MEINRILVIGDIHGGLRALHQIMERAKVTTTDTLIFLGDFVDGWSESPQVIDFLIDLSKLIRFVKLDSLSRTKLPILRFDADKFSSPFARSTVK